MVDNFERIKEFIKTNSKIEKGDFWYVSVMKRRKENPDLKKDVYVIQNFFFYSVCLDIQQFLYVQTLKQML